LKPTTASEFQAKNEKWGRIVPHPITFFLFILESGRKSGHFSPHKPKK
jgi:hypothetical protein